MAIVSEIDPALADRVRPQGDSRGFASAWETLATRCESILSPTALATLSGTDFTAADLLRQRASLYLQIPEARMSDLRPFLRLVWTSLMMQVAAAGGPLGDCPLFLSSVTRDSSILARTERCPVRMRGAAASAWRG